MNIEDFKQAVKDGLENLIADSDSEDDKPFEDWMEELEEYVLETID